MERTDYERAITQLQAAAELAVSGLPEDQRMNVMEALAFFRLRQGRIGESTVPLTSNDELFKDSAIAALTLAGRKEFLAAIALLDQARAMLSK